MNLYSEYVVNPGPGQTNSTYLIKDTHENVRENGFIQREFQLYLGDLNKY